MLIFIVKLQSFFSCIVSHSSTSMSYFLYYSFFLSKSASFSLLFLKITLAASLFFLPIIIFTSPFSIFQISSSLSRSFFIDAPLLIISSVLFHFSSLSVLSFFLWSSIHLYIFFSFLFFLSTSFSTSETSLYIPFFFAYFHFQIVIYLKFL